MRRTVILVVWLASTLTVVLRAQLPANLDCKCTSSGDGEYLCKCVAAKGPAEAAAKGSAEAPTKTTATSATPATTAVKSTTPAATTTPKSTTETSNGTTTVSGQPNYTGPRGGEYHYSASGKKVYTRKK